MTSPTPDPGTPQRSSSSTPDKVMGVVGLIAVTAMVAGGVLHSVPVLIGGFLTLFVVACWFGLAF